jgi:hypothetical protein
MGALIGDPFMKSITAIFVLLGVYVLAPHAAQAQTNARLSLATCEGYYVGQSSYPSHNVQKEPERFLEDKKREPVDFLVLIENTSSRDIGVYRQWNSWGYYSIHFVVERPDGKQTVIEKGVRAWSMNYPDCFQLPPGMTHAFPICFTSKEWKDVEALSVKGARLKAVFKQEPLDEKLKAGTKWADIQIFTNKIESTFVVWEALTRRIAN